MGNAEIKALETELEETRADIVSARMERDIAEEALTRKLESGELAGGFLADKAYEYMIERDEALGKLEEIAEIEVFDSEMHDMLETYYEALLGACRDLLNLQDMYCGLLPRVMVAKKVVPEIESPELEPMFQRLTKGETEQPIRCTCGDWYREHDEFNPAKPGCRPLTWQEQAELNDRAAIERRKEAEDALATAKQLEQERDKLVEALARERSRADAYRDRAREQTVIAERVREDLANEEEHYDSLLRYAERLESEAEQTTIARDNAFAEREGVRDLAQRLSLSEQRLREALRRAADDLGKAANQFAAMRESQKADHYPIVKNNPEIFEAKEARARTAAKEIGDG